MDTHLTPNFTIAEVSRSQTAARRGINNTPSPEILANAKYLAETYLEPIRKYLGNRVINISSWYRCPTLNEAIRGSKTSAHLTGLAIDSTAAGIKLSTYFNLIIEARDKGKIPQFDQLIWEYGEWVHLGVKPKGQTNRGQILKAQMYNGQVQYIPIWEAPK